MEGEEGGEAWSAGLGSRSEELREEWADGESDTRQWRTLRVGGAGGGDFFYHSH